MHGVVVRRMSTSRSKEVSAKSYDAVERRRRREDRKPIGAARQQAIEKVGVETIGREHRLRDALRRVLVEVEPGCAEGEIHVDDHGLHMEVASDREGEVVGDHRGADTSL